MRHRISGYAVNASGCVHLVDTIDSSKFLCGYLSRSSALGRTDCCKCERTSRANAQHAADDALFAHADTHQRVTIALFLEELHHRAVVVQRRTRRYKFIQV